MRLASSEPSTKTRAQSGSISIGARAANPTPVEAVEENQLANSAGAAQADREDTLENIHAESPEDSILGDKAFKNTLLFSANSQRKELNGNSKLNATMPVLEGLASAEHLRANAQNMEEKSFMKESNCTGEENLDHEFESGKLKPKGTRHASLLEHEKDSPDIFRGSDSEVKLKKDETFGTSAEEEDDEEEEEWEKL